MAPGRQARKAAKKARKRKSIKKGVGKKRKSKKKVVGKKRKSKKKVVGKRRKAKKKSARHKRKAIKKTARKKSKSTKKVAVKKRETVKKVSGKKRKTVKISNKAAKKTATKLSDNADFNTTTCITVPTPAKQIKKGKTEQNKQSDPADDFFRQNRVGEIVYDCKAAALSRLASIEKKFPFMKLVDKFDVPKYILQCCRYRSGGLRQPDMVCPYDWDNYADWVKGQVVLNQYGTVEEPEIESEDEDGYVNDDGFSYDYWYDREQKERYASEDEEGNANDSLIFPREASLWSTHDALCNYVRAAWIETLHEGIYLSDPAGINEFLNRNKVARLFVEPYAPIRSFVDVRDDTFRSEKSDGDFPLTRCVRINGDPVVGKVLMKAWAKAHEALENSWGRSNPFSFLDYLPEVFILCARLRRKEFARLAVKYLGHREIYNKDSRGKTLIDRGILRLIPDDVLFESPPQRGDYACTHAECATENMCCFCAYQVNSEERAEMLMSLDRVGTYDKFAAILDIMLHGSTEQEREVLRDIVMTRPRDFFSDDQQAQLVIDIGRARYTHYGSENRKSK